MDLAAARLPGDDGEGSSAAEVHGVLGWEHVCTSVMCSGKWSILGSCGGDGGSARCRTVSRVVWCLVAAGNCDCVLVWRTWRYMVVWTTER